MAFRKWNVSEFSSGQEKFFSEIFKENRLSIWGLIKSLYWNYRGLSALINIRERAGKVASVFQVYGSFGDIYMQLSVIAELVDSGVKVAVLVDKKYERLATTALGASSQILLVSQSHINSTLNRQRILGFSDILPVRLQPTLYPLVAELILRGLLKYPDFLRFLVHREVKHAGPFREIEGESERIEARDLVSKLGLRFGRTLLISPFNNTQVPIPNRVLLHAVSIARDCEWDICINTAASRSDLRGLAAEAPDIVFFDVPAHLAVSFATACGFYVVGNNGFATIQALFNSECEGLHLINSFDASEGFIKDQAGNMIEESRFPHAMMFRDQFLGVQIEHFLQNPDSFDCGAPILRARLMR